MTLYDFKKLGSLDSMMSIVNNYGFFVDSHISSKESCNLYSIDKFFVEVVYDTVANDIVRISSFKTGHLLDKYSLLDIGSL